MLILGIETSCDPRTKILNQTHIEFRTGRECVLYKFKNIFRSLC